MGNSFSLATCLAEEPDLQCGLPETFDSDGDTAGRGVFIVFVVAIATSFLAVGFILNFERREYFDQREQHRHIHSCRMLVDTYLLSLSDTQAVTTLALLISTFFLGCKISAYHYDLVCSLVLMSSAAHIGSLAVIHKYFDLENVKMSQIVRSVIRVLMILASFVMSYILFVRRWNTNIFPSFTVNSDVANNTRSKSTGLVLPAACFIGHPDSSHASNLKNFTATPNWTLNYTTQASSNHSSLYGNSSSYSASDNTTYTTMPAFTTFNSDDDFGNTGDLVALVFLTGACILAAVTSLVSFMSEGDDFWHHKFPFYSRFSCFLTTYGIAFYGLVRFQMLHDWMNDSGWFAADDDGEKTVKSFGQLMPVILLSLPVLALIESLAERSSSPQKKRGPSYHEMHDQ